MKTTIELPDELVTKIEVEAKREKKRLQDLVSELVQAGLHAKRSPRTFESEAAVKWLSEWVSLGEAATRDLPPGPTATEILAADRGRLERR